MKEIDKNEKCEGPRIDVRKGGIVNYSERDTNTDDNKSNPATIASFIVTLAGILAGHF